MIGDHGSEDRTAELAADCPDVRRIPVEYRGPNRAMVRNRLIAEARGEIIIFIDHDILVSEDWVATHVAIHRENPGALVAGMTYGKDFMRPDVDQFMSRLNLLHIQESHDLLATTDGLADARQHVELLGGCTEDPCEAGRELAPWRFFWTCNVSARASDLREVGGFDEAYEGWGLEDDDFAMQFRVHGKRMLFSRRAWAFHIPHPVATGANSMSWRRNAQIMFRKHPTREFEYFLLNGREIGSGARRLERQVRRIREIDIAAAVAEAATMLPAPRGRRLYYLAHGLDEAVRLRASDALVPYAPLASLPWTERGVRCWSLFGITTPFARGEFDESVLLVDALLLVERHLLVWVLCEAARISRRVYLALGPASRDRTYELAVSMVREIVDLLGGPVHWI